MRHKHRKITHCQVRVSIWDADVKDIYKTVDSEARTTLFLNRGMGVKLQKGTLLRLRWPRGLTVTLWLPSNWCQHKTAFNTSQGILHRHRQFIHVHISCKGYGEKKKRRHLIFHRPVSCTCARPINISCIHTEDYQGYKNMCTHTQTISLYSENQQGSCCPHDWWLCQHEDQKNIKAAFDVLLVWITSIDSFDRNGKPLLCNGRSFWGRWVFPFCNILRAKLGTVALWTGGCWLGKDNGTSSEPQQVERKDQSNHEALSCPVLAENVYFIVL